MTGPCPLDMKQERLHPGEAVFGFLTLFSLGLILRNPEMAVEAMTRGLRLCAESVIPALFPFMVLSEMLVGSGLASLLGGRLARPLGRGLRLSGAGCTAYLLGLLCGFPVGARCALRALERGELDRGECERILGISGMPSSAFLVGTVGVTLFGDRRMGLMLWVSVLLASLLVALIGAVGEPREDLEPPPIPERRQSGFVTVFTRAVRDAAGSMLTVCAYVVFFSALIGVLRGVIASFLPDGAWSALLLSLFELSSGMQAAAEVTSPLLGAILAAFAAGWSGLSVHFQLLSLADGYGLSFRRYFRDKALMALIAAGAFFVLWKSF